MEKNYQFHLHDAAKPTTSVVGNLQSINEGAFLPSVAGVQNNNSGLKITNSSANESHGLKNINRGEFYNSDFEFKVNRNVSRVIELIYSDEYIEGESSKTQLYLEFLYHKDKAIFLEAFNRAWVALYTADSHYITTFLNVASTIDYDWLGYRADSIVMGFNSLPDPYVNEAAIRALESWGQKSHVSILEKMRDFDQGWVQQYKVDVLEYLRSL